jgi:hypothetical protein
MGVTTSKQERVDAQLPACTQQNSAGAIGGCWLMDSQAVPAYELIHARMAGVPGS